jgi:hypothetical protein
LATQPKQTKPTIPPQTTHPTAHPTKPARHVKHRLPRPRNKAGPHGHRRRQCRAIRQGLPALLPVARAIHAGAQVGEEPQVQGHDPRQDGRVHGPGREAQSTPLRLRGQAQEARDGGRQRRVDGRHGEGQGGWRGGGARRDARRG